MNRILAAVFAVLLGLLVGVPDAEAKRFGGGRSFGMQRDAGTLSSPAPRTRDAAAPTGAAAPSAGVPPRRTWTGALTGLAAGLGISALLAHFGLGEEFAGVVMAALLAFGGLLLLRMVIGTTTVARRPMAHAGRAPSASLESVHAPAGRASGASTERRDFDAAGFARQAKLNFIRLQAASDRGDLDDIRAFTTPEVFAEVAMQLRERGDETARTDVVELDAQVLDVAENERGHLVSVRFAGTLREAPAAAPEAFAEIWHLTKPCDGSDGWRVAGIQQG